MPGQPSDVFTCGLMLYELLAGYHPYWQEDQADYAQQVRAYAARPPALLQLMPGAASNAEVSAALYRCLSPDPAARLSAAELRAILSGRHRKAEPPASTLRPTAPGRKGGRASPGGTAPRPARDPIASQALELVAPDGRSLRIGVRTELGKALVRQFGPDGEFWDHRQCLIERNATGRWTVTPVAATTNETIVNGETITRPRELRQGDSIGVGREAKGIVKLPLTVRGL
jgi:hypothetical protein